MTNRTWLITGASRGFGRALALAALRAGDCVVATARRPEQFADLVGEFPDSVLTRALDVTDPVAARQALADGVARFGRIDVIVNNAGYANLAAIETGDDEDIRAQFETNFWGVYNVSKAAIPILRAQGGGLIVQFSSIGGRVGGTAGLSSYQAAKFAIDGFSRVLQTETAPFGIQVLVVEPSAFATDWAGASMTVQPVTDDYRSTVGMVGDRMQQNAAGAAGDPERAAEILVQMVRRTDIPYQLPLGVNAAESTITSGEAALDEAKKWRLVSRSADFAEPYPADFPADAVSSS